MEYPKVKDSIKKSLIITRTRKISIWEKTNNSHQCQNDRDVGSLELSDKDFKAITIKMLQQAIKNVVEIFFLNRKSQQRNRRYKEETNGNLELKNTPQINSVNQLNSRMEGICEKSLKLWLKQKKKHSNSEKEWTKKNEQRLRNYGTVIKDLTFV